MRSSKITILGCLLFAATLNTACAAEPVKIRVGWVVPITDWALLMTEKRDIARHLGQSYVMEPIHFGSSPEVITALASGELDVGNLAFSTLALAIQNAGLSDLRVVSDLFQDGVEGYYSNEFFVRRDSLIVKVEDLKGKIVATPGPGGAIDIAMRIMLRKHGLDDRRDVTTVEAPLPAMTAMLTDGKVDLAPGVPPFYPAMRQIGRVLFAQKEALGPSQMIVLTAREPFLQKNRAAMVDFMEDTLRIARWYLNSSNHDEAVQIAARLTKQPPERFANWIFERGDYYRNPQLLPNIDVLQSNIDLQRQAGFLKRSINIKENIDLSVIVEAARRLN